MTFIDRAVIAVVAGSVERLAVFGILLEPSVVAAPLYLRDLAGEAHVAGLPERREEGALMWMGNLGKGRFAHDSPFLPCPKMFNDADRDIGMADGEHPRGAGVHLRA